MIVRRLPRSLALAAGVAAALTAAGGRAQTPSVQASSEQAPSEQPPAQPYRDRIIAPENLQPLPPDEDEAIDSSGLPRSFRAEINLSHTERGQEGFTEQGVSAGGFWETATLGSFSLDAALFHSDRDRFEDEGLGGTATLWQRNLYLDGGWRADNGLGVLNTPSLPLQRSQYRFYLPSVPFAGASSEWVHEQRGLRLQGAFGRAGNYNGTRVVGFDVADGSVGSLGAQWSWAPQWTGAASFLATHGRIVPDAQGEAVFEQGDTQALHLATAWQGARDSLQFNLLSSDGDRGQATGAWLDASAERGRYTHHYGVFRLDPNLSWGALPINHDVEGGYYRIAYQYGRWMWNGGLDRIRSISGTGFDGTYATGFGRYQASSTLGYGGSLSVRHTPDNAYSAQVFADKRTEWGQTRLQLDQARTGSDHADSWQVSLDHAYPLKQGARLSTSVAYGELAYNQAEATQTATLALYGGFDLTDRLSIDGTARWSHGDGPSAMRGTDINLGVNWRMASRWWLVASFFQSEGSQRSPFILDPLVTETPFISLPRDRSIFLTLRYERQAGRPQGVIGGAPGGAVGSVSGSVFLDDNDDGVRAASEQAAINVTVVLDGRYSVRTDSLGRFEFPRVATGAHTLSIVPDNLPLPWFIAEADAQRSVQVSVRQDTHVDVGARRQR